MRVISDIPTPRRLFLSPTDTPGRKAGGAIAVRGYFSPDVSYAAQVSHKYILNRT